MFVFLLLAQVPNYSELPPRPDPVVARVCAARADDLNRRATIYERWVREHEIINGGLLDLATSRIYQVEARLAIKPFVEALQNAARMGASPSDCDRIHMDGWTALGDTVGPRWAVSHGYQQTQDGYWERVR